jgi:biotin synthase
LNKKIFLCAISNISSGRCTQDCKFCTQSIKYKANIDRFYKKPIQHIIEEAKVAYKNKAVGFCLVTATKELDDKTLEFISQVAYNVKKEVPNISLIGCAGMASVEALKELKKNGIENYNHNLETSKEFYNNICTTHSWQDRFDTCINVLKSDMFLCAGGIFGLGESQEDRISMLESLKELNPMSVPINFYHPNEALPLINKTISDYEAFECIKLTKEYLPNSMLMVAGGREITLGDKQYDIFKYGANSIVIGDYLTTNGEDSNKDIKAIEKLGYILATSCHED